MAFPTSQINTDNLDSDSDNPAAARADLFDAVTKLNTIISEANAANGVALLNASGNMDSNKLPQTIAFASGNQIIAPSSGIVNIQDIIRLTAQPKSDILAINTATLTVGDIALASDVNSGAVGICLYNGTGWVRIATDGAVT
jgi:hypothetical protein